MQKTESNARDSYKLYKSISENPISSKDYLDIGAGYREFMIEKVLEGEEVTIPAKIGTLAIVGTKRKLRFNDDGTPILPPDWKATKALWDRNPEAKRLKKRVFCTNEHTGGVVFKLLWSKRRVPMENKSLFAFRLVKGHKIAINKSIESGKEYLTKNL